MINLVTRKNPWSTVYTDFMLVILSTVFEWEIWQGIYHLTLES